MSDADHSALLTPARRELVERVTALGPVFAGRSAAVGSLADAAAVVAGTSGTQIDTTSGYVLAGSVVPLLLLFHPRLGDERCTLAAAALAIAGAFAWLYVFIIGGQAFPLEIFPGHVVSSTFGDGAVEHYVPSLPELLLGLGGVGAAFLMTTVGVRVLDFLPRDDAVKAPVT